ncbi:MAG: branched-chain amino acid ABC transporter substrate-binding protein [Elusimicrobia bacterium]|nr:branched-chain amino acid ABC transporter substrate-binding protein [Elusimicrobiota bacterium]
MDSLKRALAAVLVLLPCACGPRQKTVKIAVAAPMTGDLGTEGQGLLRAVILAVEQANAARRFPYQLEAVPYDDRADPGEAVNVANLIIADPTIVAVVGHYNSSCALAAAAVYARAPVAMIAPSATSPEVTFQQLSADWGAKPRVVFRLVPTDELQGDYAAGFVYRRLGKRRIAVVHDQTTYGQGLAERFRKTFERLGGKVVLESGIAPGQKDFKAVLLRAAAAKPDGLYFGGLYTEAGLLVKELRELGMKTAFISGDGAKTPGLFDVAGEAADGAYLTMVGVPVEMLPSARGFMDDYRRRWTAAEEGIRPFDHLGYEAAQIVFDALEAVGPDDRLDRAKIVAALRRTRHSGIAGLTAFDQKGDTLNTIITMTRADAKGRSFPVLR